MSEFFEPYTPMPFGLTLEDTVQYAIARFSSRWGDLEDARERGQTVLAAGGRARRAADETVRDVVAWMARELDSTPVGMQGDAGTVYTLRVGDPGRSALLITREVLDYHSAADVIGALRTHGVPRRLREPRVRLTCLRAGGKIIVQAPDEGA